MLKALADFCMDLANLIEHQQRENQQTRLRRQRIAINQQRMALDQLRAQEIRNRLRIQELAIKQAESRLNGNTGTLLQNAALTRSGCHRCDFYDFSNTLTHCPECGNTLQPLPDPL